MREPIISIPAIEFNYPNLLINFRYRRGPKENNIQVTNYRSNIETAGCK